MRYFVFLYFKGIMQFTSCEEQLFMLLSVFVSLLSFGSSRTEENEVHCDRPVSSNLGMFVFSKGDF